MEEHKATFQNHPVYFLQTEQGIKNFSLKMDTVDK